MKPGQIKMLLVLLCLALILYAWQYKTTGQSHRYTRELSIAGYVWSAVLNYHSSNHSWPADLKDVYVANFDYEQRIRNGNITLTYEGTKLRPVIHVKATDGTIVSYGPE